jgi:hypothetical protein
MKKLIRGLMLMIALATFQNSASAQDVFSWGARLGAASTNIDANPQTIYDGTTNIDTLLLSVTNANFGIHGGLYARLKLGPIYIQPELLFNTESYEYSVQDLGQSGVTQILNDRFSTFDLPIMVGLKAGPVRIQAGPIGTVLVSNNNQLETLTETYKRELQNLTWGYQAGLGVDIGSVNLDLKYEGGLESTLGDSYEIYGNTYNFDSRENRWVLTVGLKF